MLYDEGWRRYERLYMTRDGGVTKRFYDEGWRRYGMLYMTREGKAWKVI